MNFGLVSVIRSTNVAVFGGARSVFVLADTSRTSVCMQTRESLDKRKTDASSAALCLPQQATRRCQFYDLTSSVRKKTNNCVDFDMCCPPGLGQFAIEPICYKSIVGCLIDFIARHLRLQHLDTALCACVYSKPGVEVRIVPEKRVAAAKFSSL